MRDVPATMTAGWKNPIKTGPRRPIVRATIQRTQVRSWHYDTAEVPGGRSDSLTDPHRSGVFTSLIFGNNNPVREIKNIRACNWERSLDQDVATCTLELLNSEVSPIGADENEDGDFDQPGYYTFSRGASKVAQLKWGHEENGWKNIFVPDATVKTYEGYGINEDVDPHLDEHLVQTGFWLIDKVTYGANGSVSLEMRDLGRLMLDQIAFPPVVPPSEYPVGWSHLRREEVPGRDAKGGKWRDLRGRARAKSSNDLYVGHGYRNGKHAYVDARGGVHGHYASMGLKNDQAYFDPYGTLKPKYKSYWLSTGQKHQNDFAWWQADLYDKTTALNALRIHSFGPGYVYISLLGKKGWYGRKKIPYKPGSGVFGRDINADIPFVTKVRAEAGVPFDVILPKVYGDVRAIRLTFTSMWYDWGVKGQQYPWYSGLHDLMIYTHPSKSHLKFGRGTVLKTVGNYRDYSDIPRMVCSWAGFWHPERTTRQNFIRTGVGSDRIWYDYPWGPLGTMDQSTRLPRGMHFGDIRESLTHAQSDLTPDMFDKKPLMDMINYVRDILGFIWFVDDVGHVNWRRPNMWRPGNFKLVNRGDGTQASPYQRRLTATSEIPVFEDTETVLDYSTVLSSQNIRERIFVANQIGNFGVVIKGYNPVETGMRRMAGWTDQKFANRRETLVMADMLAAAAMFDYRRGRLKTPGYPKIQIDDQIRIYERVTNETFYHYVLGVKSENNMEEGTWTYDVETHWLGEKQGDAWVIDAKTLQAETRSFLNLLK